MYFEKASSNLFTFSDCIFISSEFKLTMNNDEETKNSESSNPSRILHLLKLDFFQGLKEPKQVSAKKGLVGVLRGLLDLFFFLASTITGVWVLAVTSECFSAEKLTLIASVFVLGAFTKLFLLSLRFSKRAQKKLTERRYFFLKAVSSLFFTSHLVPCLDMNADCEEDYPGIWVSLGILCVYIITVLFPLGLFITSRAKVDCNLLKLDKILKVFLKTLCVFLGVFGLFSVALAIAFLRQTKLLPVFELTGACYYLVFSAYYTCSKHSSNATEPV